MNNLDDPCSTLMTSREIHVHYAEIRLTEAAVQRFEPVLSPDEIIKAHRYRYASDRERYIIARGIVRLILSRYLKIHPVEVVFRYGEFGKPMLDIRHGEILQFNVSHTNTLVAVVVSAYLNIGIDIEQLTMITDHDDLVAHYFCPNEIAAFNEVETCGRPLTFLNAWTRKEAYLKAIGTGLSGGLHQVCVTSKPGEPAAFFDSELNMKWCLAGLSPPLSHVGAVVYQRKHSDTRLRIIDMTVDL